MVPAQEQNRARSKKNSLCCFNFKHGYCTIYNQKIHFLLVGSGATIAYNLSNAKF